MQQDTEQDQQDIVNTYMYMYVIIVLFIYSATTKKIMEYKISNHLEKSHMDAWKT